MVDGLVVPRFNAQVPRSLEVGVACGAEGDIAAEGIGQTADDGDAGRSAVRVVGWMLHIA